MELHHLTEYPSAQLRVYFLTSPKHVPQPHPNRIGELKHGSRAPGL
jgi:hypothetical protein